jgi:hypothetical protein
MINITTTSISVKAVHYTYKRTKSSYFIPKFLIDIKGKPMKEYTHTHTSMMKDEPRKERRERYPFQKKKSFKFSSCRVETGGIERMQKNILFVKRSS